MKSKDKNLKYLIKSNNYVGLLFFALVLASLLYIAKSEEKILKNEIDNDMTKQITVPVHYTNETEELNNLIKYLNKGTENTYKTYETTYQNIDITKIGEESLLYMAYNYLIQYEENQKTRNITCEEAELLNIKSEIIECGGDSNYLEEYQINYKINKQTLKNTIKDIYNINIINNYDFYTAGTNKCTFVNNEYICLTKKTMDIIDNGHGEANFIEAYIYEDKIEIIEEYKYIKNNKNYTDINCEQEGTQNYISTFRKVNGKYYYEKTEIFQ